MGAVLAATGLVAVSPGPAHAAEWWETSTAGWYDGQVSYSQVLNCFSVIQGSPYYEAGVGAYIGYLADPQNARPAEGDKGWIRYRVYGMGNPCTGGSYFRPRFFLPAGMGWDTTRQIQCAYDGSGGSAPQANCPGWGNMDGTNAYWNNGAGSGGNLWGVAQGHYWEFQLPVTMTQPLSGAILDAQLEVADGNSNPTMLLRNSNVYVFSFSGAGPTTVLYDQPSSYDAATLPWDPPGVPTTYGMLSTFQAVVDGRAGTAYVQISPDASFTTILGVDQVSFPSSYNSIDVTTDWSSPIPGLTSGTTYYWRGLVVTGGVTAIGATQSFVLKPGGGVVASTVGGASGGGVGTGSGGVPGGTITPVPQPQPPPPPPPAPAPAPSPAPAPAPAPAAASTVVATTAKASKGIKVTLTCSGPCSAKASAKVSKKTAKKLGVKSTTIGTAKASISPAGSKVFTITLSKAVRARITKLGKITASVKVTRTVGGSVSTTTTKVTVKR